MKPRGAREAFAAELLHRLWDRYLSRVEYARVYERVVREAGAVFSNDHVAFRALAWQDPPAGASCVSRVFEALGWSQAGCYVFPDKRLSSVHYRHPNPSFPKIFVSELKTWELPAECQAALKRALKEMRKPPPDADLAAVSAVERLDAARRARLLNALDRHFADLPWDPPDRRDVMTVDAQSQFGAWVLLHGYEVNHFTASVNSHGVPDLDDIDKTVAALRRAGVPMKADIEGSPGSRLRQSATESVVASVRARDAGRAVRLPWPYAYFEIAERGEWTDPLTGRRERFEGFLGPQANQLFDMTAREHASGGLQASRAAR